MRRGTPSKRYGSWLLQRRLVVAGVTVLLVFAAAYLLSLCDQPLRGADRVALGEDAWKRWGYRSGMIMLGPRGHRHEVEGSAAYLRVLFVGNSFVHYNDGVEKVLAGLLQERMGKQIYAARYAPGGYGWAQHWVDANDKQHVLFSLLGAGGSAHWDFVIFQEQSQQPGLQGRGFEASLKALQSLAGLAKARGAVSVLMTTWAYAEGDSSHPDLFSSYQSMQERLNTGYLTLARELGSRLNTSAFVAPVGLAWARVRHLTDAARAGVGARGGSTSSGGPPGDWSLPYGIATFGKLYAADQIHPSAPGTYLAACVVAAALTGCHTSGLQYRPASVGPRWPPFLQAVADWAVHEATPRDAPPYPWTSATTCGGPLPTLTHARSPPHVPAELLTDTGGMYAGRLPSSTPTPPPSTPRSGNVGGRRSGSPPPTPRTANPHSPPASTLHPSSHSINGIMGRPKSYAEARSASPPPPNVASRHPPPPTQGTPPPPNPRGSSLRPLSSQGGGRGPGAGSSTWKAPVINSTKMEHVARRQSSLQAESIVVAKHPPGGAAIALNLGGFGKRNTSDMLP